MRLLDIEEKVEDVIVLKNETALLECKVAQNVKSTCSWYKDGQTLERDDDRISIIKNSAWHRLEIKQASSNDVGIYVLESWKGHQYKALKGHLYVAPRDINDGAFYYNIKHRGPGVIKHLLNVKVYTTETINLVATFRFTSDKYYWYKNNDVVLQDKRTKIKKSEGTASLIIKNAQPADAGIYYVVTSTKQGYLSSCADVQVGDHKEIRPVFPILKERLPENMVVFAGEELRIVLQAQLDKDTIIQWDKDGALLQTPDIVKMDYGNNYLGITISGTNINSAGFYRVVLMNSVMYQVVSSSTHVQVKRKYYGIIQY